MRESAEGGLAPGNMSVALAISDENGRAGLHGLAVTDADHACMWDGDGLGAFHGLVAASPCHPWRDFLGRTHECGTHHFG